MKTTTNSILYLVVALFIGLASCEKVNDPYEGIVIEGPDTTTTNPIDTNQIDTTGDYDITYQSHKTLLVEEFTGLKCGNCPEGSDWIAAKSSSNDAEDFVFIAYHVGSLASPDASGKYALDLTNPQAEKFYTDEGTPPQPSAIFQRTGSALGFNGTGATWDGFYNDLKTNGHFASGSSDVLLGIGNAYLEKDDKLNITLAADVVTQPDSNYKVVGVILEGGIIGYQKDYKLLPDRYRENYEFKHVFRHVFTSSLKGDDFYDDTATRDDNITKSYSVSLDGKVDVPKNCYVVAFIVNATTGQVVTAMEQKVHVQ